MLFTIYVINLRRELCFRCFVILKIKVYEDFRFSCLELYVSVKHYINCIIGYIYKSMRSLRVVSLTIETSFF